MEKLEILVPEKDDYEEMLLRAVKEFLEKHPEYRDRFLEELGVVKLQEPVE
ncbi:MAG: hypothetical protein DDT22_01332 [candidate division WS2 bacterium]|nr:hypothetical protein [Candidatus Lithacetigena glycinireducens]